MIFMNLYMYYVSNTHTIANVIPTNGKIKGKNYFYTHICMCIYMYVVPMTLTKVSCKWFFTYVPYIEFVQE